MEYHPGLKKTFFSFSILIIITLVLLFFTYDKKNGESPFFAAVILFMLAQVAGLLLGVIAIPLRLLNILKLKNGFIYVFIGSLNLYLGLVGVLLILGKGMPDSNYLQMLIRNFLFGIFMFWEVFRNKPESSIQKNSRKFAE